MPGIPHVGAAPPCYGSLEIEFGNVSLGAQFEIGIDALHSHRIVRLHAQYPRQCDVDFGVGGQKADGGADTGAHRHNHFRHPELARQARGMQRSRTTEGHKRILARVSAAFDGHDTHRSLHIAVGNGMDAPRGFLEGQRQRPCDVAFDAGARCNRIERHATAAEPVRVEIAQHQIGVRDGWLRTALAIANGSWFRPSAPRPNLDQRTMGHGDATAAGTDLDQLDGRDVER